MSDFLKRYRTKLKLEATQQLEATVTKLFNIIADDSELKNTIIMLQARYQNLEQDVMKDIIAGPDRELRTNKITNNLFQLIDNIEVADLQESDDLLLNGYLMKREASVEEKSVPEKIESTPSEAPKSTTDSPKVEPPITEVPTTSIVPLVSAADAEKKEITAEPKSAKDLEIFSEMHRKTLTFFPVIYRDIRSLVFKNGKASLEMGQLMDQVEKALPILHAFQSKSTQLEPILKKIRVDYDKKVYWMQFQQLSNKRTALTVANLSDIEKMNKDMDTFIEALRRVGVLA